jgi:ABC-2 type transport system ATP-binding protein
MSPARPDWDPGRVRAADVTSVVHVKGLRKSYGGVERLHGISFEVYPGEILGFLGPNGAGKTTTIEILEGYRRRDAGTVSVLGSDPARGGRAWHNRIGLVLQDCALDPMYTVRETVSMFARYFDRPTDVVETIAVAGLTEKLDQRIAHLSGGQKRRVDVALGLIGDPEILFLDEPTTGLDPAARREMWAVITGLRDAGKTVFLTTHYMDEAQQLADRIILLRAGEVAAEGTADELRHRLSNRTAVTFTLPDGVSPDGLSAVLGAPVEIEHDLVRFASANTQRDLTALLVWAEREQLELADLQVAMPTLDDVFVTLADAQGPRSHVGQGDE